MKQAVPHIDRFRSLDAWRGICALLVALFHAPIYHAFKDAPGFYNLQLCVDFFFVLSGFVLSHAYRDRLGNWREGGAFMLARFRRLWPLHVVILALFVGLELAKLGFGHADPGFQLDAQPFAEGHTPTEIVTNLFFLQAFGLHPGLSWNGPSWSIAVEFWTSALFAAVVLLVPLRRNWIFAAFVVLSGVGLAVLSPKTLFVSYDWAILRCIFGFSAGCLVYAFRQRFPAPRLPFGLSEAVCVVLAVAFMALTQQGPEHLAAPLIFAPLIYVFSFERGPISAVLKGSWAQALGRWSFSIYMVHMFLFQLLKSGATAAEHKTGLDLVIFHNGEKLVMFGAQIPSFIATLVFLAVVVVPVGALCHHFVEVPLARWPARTPKRTPSPRPAMAS